VKITTAQEMFGLGQQLGSQLRAGDLILLNGPLGAGKTVLVQGIGAALGIKDVTSPTFLISRTHSAPLPLIHVDIYRLLEDGKAAAYLDDLDLDAAAQSGVTVIEWGGLAATRLNEQRLEITIDNTDDIREVSINTVGARWQGFKV
jgi:tRNA threonylcarbamoyladenosine biosynthesis protein TsaE